MSSLNATSIKNITITDMIVASLGQFAFTICAYNPANQVNPDLGGIGVSTLTSLRKRDTEERQVYASYWIQSGLAFLGFLATVFWILLVPYIWFGLLAFRQGHEVAWEKLESTRSRARKQGSPLIAALIELHKSQCFFMVNHHQLCQYQMASKVEFEPEFFYLEVDRDIPVLLNAQSWLSLLM